MKKLLLISIFFSIPLFAALPPVWQGIAELKAIVNDPKLNNYLDSGDVLEGVYRNKGGWTIKTNRREVQVVIISKPQDMPGPERFELKFYEKRINDGA